MTDVNFSWKNYFKPTPANLQYFSGALKGIIASVGGTTLIMEANKWVTFSILLTGYILDEAVKFFGHVEEEAKRVITVEMPPDTNAEIKDEIK